MLNLSPWGWTPPPPTSQEEHGSYGAVCGWWLLPHFPRSVGNLQISDCWKRSRLPHLEWIWAQQEVYPSKIPLWASFWKENNMQHYSSIHAEKLLEQQSYGKRNAKFQMQKKLPCFTGCQVSQENRTAEGQSIHVLCTRCKDLSSFDQFWTLGFSFTWCLQQINFNSLDPAFEHLRPREKCERGCISSWTVQKSTVTEKDKAKTEAEGFVHCGFGIFIYLYIYFFVRFLRPQCNRRGKRRGGGLINVTHVLCWC